jgi:YD repeat-containing protein
MKQAIVGLLILLGLRCAISGPLNAQCDPSESQIGNGGLLGQPMGILGEFDCIPEGPFLSICSLMNSTCPPPNGASETHAMCPSHRATAYGGQPICLADGNTFIDETDVNVPGLGGGLSLVRTWNSLWPASQSAVQVGLFGPNWRSNFEERVFVGSDNYIKYARGDGSFWSFGFAGIQGGNVTMTVAAPANTSATMSVQSTPYWIITFTNGEKKYFNTTSGNLVSIVDRNGNTTQLSYDSVDRLVAVTDPASRHLYFGYASGSSYLVTSVTSDFGVSLSYSYDTQGRLLQVTNPDSSTISFSYDSNSFISSVTDSQGKILESHTYDSGGHGLSSSRANGVDALTVSYGNP